MIASKSRMWGLLIHADSGDNLVPEKLMLRCIGSIKFREIPSVIRRLMTLSIIRSVALVIWAVALLTQVVGMVNSGPYVLLMCRWRSVGVSAGVDFAMRLALEVLLQ